MKVETVSENVFTESTCNSEVQRVFWAALEKLPEERSKFVHQVSSGSDVVRSVESLLENVETASLKTASDDESRADIARNTRVSGYTVEGLIACGGMGEVYVATRLSAGFDIQECGMTTACVGLSRGLEEHRLR